MGYSNAGVVLESIHGNFCEGDRVVSNGPHAEIVNVPGTLCARIPDDVDDEAAAFTVVGAVALQGIRLAQPAIGENVAVVGAGLIGQICIQLLRASGCRVLAVDTNETRCTMAQEFGATALRTSESREIIDAADHFSGGYGMDAVIIAATTQSHSLIKTSAQISRKRGRIVLIGSVGLNLQRDDFYKKELTFQVSSSYGPGRYDRNYEDGGQDYPLPFVRWTAQRNFEAVLEMMSSSRLNIEPLISHRIELDSVVDAYALLDTPSSLGIILTYGSNSGEGLRNRSLQYQRTCKQEVQKAKNLSIIGVIGGGNYVSGVLIPALRKSGAVLETLVTSDGVSGIAGARKGRFKGTSTDLGSIWDNSEINAVVIGTRHNRHAEEIVLALNSGRHVFVEKPLALTLEDINKVEAAYHAQWRTGKNLILMVGFNRRFAPLVRTIKELLHTKVQPKSIIYTVNAGHLPQDHWISDLKVGGGRIVGEVCHFVDIIRHLVGFPIKSFQAINPMPSSYVAMGNEERATINLVFNDGSTGTIHYFANGSRKFPKERLEIFCGNGVLQLDNFRALKGYDWPGFKRKFMLRQDKGNEACIHAFVDAVSKNTESPIPPEEIFEVSRETVRIANVL
jgi:predicted dehydrogenase/threonine dehydrogenase-like Zn-dependent dehydrogenase